MDCSLPRSSIHGIFQARVLEWVAICFSSLEIELALNKILLFILFYLLLPGKEMKICEKPGVG